MHSSRNIWCVKDFGSGYSYVHSRDSCLRILNWQLATDDWQLAANFVDAHLTFKEVFFLQLH